MGPNTMTVLSAGARKSTMKVLLDPEVLEGICDDIDEFDAVCEELEYTDSGEAQKLLRYIREQVQHLLNN